MKKILLTTCLFLFLFFLFPSRAYGAKLLLSPDNKTVTSGEQFTVSLILDSEGKAVNGIDVTLTYPQNILWVDKVDSSGIFSLRLQKILKNEGRLVLNFSAGRFSGQSWLANLTLSTHATGEGWLNFICDDINIWEADTSTDLVNCNNLKKGVYKVEAKAAVSATPTPIPVQPDCMPLNPPGNLQAETGSGVGQVTLKWDTVKNADYYAITYGLVSAGYIYGAPNIGKGTQYTVSGMAAGRKYYFVLTSVNRCGSSGYSPEVSAKAGGSLPVPSAADEKGGWQPGGAVVQVSPRPSVIVLPVVSPVATASAPLSGADAQPSFAPEPTGSPTGFIPAKPEPFWRGLDFWKKVGIVACALFVLLLIISFLRGKGSREGEENPYQVVPPAAPLSGAEAPSDGAGEREAWPPPAEPETPAVPVESPPDWPPH